LKDGGATVTADVSFGDNDKAIFGAGSDLQIFHDAGGTSHIRESGPSHLYIEASNLRLKSSADTGETYLTANLDGAVSLYYDNAVKLATTSTGVDITGTLTSDEVTVQQSAFTRALVGSTGANGAMLVLDGDSNGDGSGGDYSYIYHNTSGQLEFLQNSPSGTNEMLFNTAGNNLRMKIGSGGDISFYEDTGTTAKFFWDASAERLAIGVGTSPDAAMHVGEASYPQIRTVYNGIDSWDMGVTSGSIFKLGKANAADSASLFQTDSGNVGIGTSSPDNNSGYTALTLSNTTGSGGGQVYVKASSAVGVFGADNASSGTNAKVILQTNTSHPLVLGTNGTERMRIDSSGRVKLHEDLVQDEVKATTTATTQVSIDTFPHAFYDGAKVVITAATSADTYVTELLIATNGTTAVATEYGQIGTGSALATYDVDISGADVRILATPASTTSTTFRVAMTLT